MKNPEKIKKLQTPKKIVNFRFFDKNVENLLIQLFNKQFLIHRWVLINMENRGQLLMSWSCVA